MCLGLLCRFTDSEMTSTPTSTTGLKYTSVSNVISTLIPLPLSFVCFYLFVCSIFTLYCTNPVLKIHRLFMSINFLQKPVFRSQVFYDYFINIYKRKILHY